MDTPKKFFDIRAGEWQATLSMFTFWFSAITVFQILRPLKAGLFIEYLGAKTELIAGELMNIVVAALAMVVFTFLYNRLGGRRLVYFLCSFSLPVCCFSLPQLAIVLPTSSTGLSICSATCGVLSGWRHSGRS